MNKEQLEQLSRWQEKAKMQLRLIQWFCEEAQLITKEDDMTADYIWGNCTLEELLEVLSENSGRTNAAQVEQIIRLNQSRQVAAAAKDARIAELEQALASLQYYCGNPSAWEIYDDEMSERIRKACEVAEPKFWMK